MRRPMHEMLEKASKRISLHMPASQGNTPFEAMDPYVLETTELAVTDDLYKPNGAIREAEVLLAKSANAKASFLLQGGSTAGIHAMILYACKRGDGIILPRNTHLSAINICAVAGIHPVFADLEELPGGFVTTTCEAYRNALKENPQVKAALVLSSDYYGLLTDLPAIADTLHEQGKLVLCDEAHGAYFNWRKDVQNAGQKGADMFVQSAHKTLPAFNPAAWLHAMDGIDPDKLRAILRMTQTSSPSFVLMQSMDDARAWMDAHGQEVCVRLQKAMDAFFVEVNHLGYVDDRDGLTADRLRLVLRAPQGGAWLQQTLQELGIDVEMSDTHHIVCILSLLDGEKRLKLLLEALRNIAKEKPSHVFQPLKQKPDEWPKRVMPLHEAAFADTVMLAPRDAVGRISAASVGLYPPGIAWLTAGEVISNEIAGMMITTPAHRLFGMNGGIRCVK